MFEFHMFIFVKYNQLFFFSNTPQVFMFVDNTLYSQYNELKFNLNLEGRYLIRLEKDTNMFSRFQRTTFLKFLKLHSRLSIYFCD